ncbi:hypothetical protein OG394_26645 [Kribbella sp. NBC_01245]|uniref:hypothetical protein n=1 Tax=Kribbella sp. NBC_01245 TaxID=2903578 RepID=UPI002E2DACA9|nr:hypothetical protein [Kribbella sp. NBC_01245]
MAAADHSTHPARRSTAFVYWICVVLTLLVGVFLAVDASAGGYGTPAWVGTSIAAIGLLALAGLYAACALGRIRLETSILAGRFKGKATYLHVTVVCLVLVIGADILIPNREAGSLAVLFPFGIAYWLSHATSEH